MVASVSSRAPQREPTPLANHGAGAAWRRHGLLLRWLPLAPVAAAFVHCAHSGWRRWGDLLIDTGRELELPRRLLAGEHLYTDLRYYYGPLAPHVNATLYRIFGVHADVLMLAGIATAALVALAVWLLTARLANRLGATVTTVAFIYVCAFPNLGAVAIFNFALPYTFAATYGMLVALWSLVFLVRHVDREVAQARSRGRGGIGDLVGSVGLLALATFTKVETLTPVLAVHGLFVLWLLVRRRFRVVPHLALYMGALLSSAAGWSWIAWRTGPTLWRDNLGGVVNSASRSFVLRMMGLADLTGSATSLALSILLVAIALLALGGVARWEGPERMRRAAIAATTTGVFACFAVWGIEFGLPVVPWVALAALVLPNFVTSENGGHISATTASNGGDASPVRQHAACTHHQLGFALVCAFAVVSLLRVFLRPLPDGYGFYLLTPALVVVGTLLFHHLPERCATDRLSRDALVAGAAALLLGIATACFIASDRQYEAYTIEIATDRGHILIRPDY
jgi:hypothetical protein